MNLQSISLDDFLSWLYNSPALVVGPGITSSTGIEDDWASTIAPLLGRQGSEVKQDWMGAIERGIMEGAVMEADILSTAKAFFSDYSRRNPQIATLPRGSWSAVVSLALDEWLAKSMKEALRQRSARRSVSVIAQPRVQLPTGSVPYYSLLGDIGDLTQDSRITIRSSSYLRRRAVWSDILRDLPSLTRGAPLLFLGTESIPGRVADLLSEMLRLGTRTPARIIFLEDDPTPEHWSVANLLTNDFTTVRIKCELKDLIAALADRQSSVDTLPLFRDLHQKQVPLAELTEYSDLAQLVPHSKPPAVTASERNRTLDALFQPAHLDWSPYAADFVLNRDASASLLDAVKSQLAGKTGHVVHVQGDSGVGKTTVMRSTAFALAQSGIVTIWIRRTVRDVPPERRDGFALALSVIAKRVEAPICIFIDDARYAPIKVDHLESKFASRSHSWCCIYSSRLSDTLSSTNDTNRPKLSDEELQVIIPNKFSVDEWTKIPEYLVKLGVAVDINDAQSKMPAVGLASSTDVLASLWFMLPQTRASFEQSIKSEYLRLGDPQIFVDAIWSASDTPNSMSSLARRAYEFVAVCSDLDECLIPLEVLIDTLGCKYSDWLGSQSGSRSASAWGLIYEEGLPDDETFGYRTRNSRVSEILCRLIPNSYDLIKKLIMSCSSELPQYRYFVRELLIERRKLLVDRFGTLRVLELFDQAMGVVPRVTIALRHHRAIVLREIRGKEREAYAEILKLIQIHSDDQGGDSDTLHNLHTSSAATIRKLVEDGLENPSAGLSKAIYHVEEALQGHPFSTHAYHVQANTLLSFANTSSELSQLERNNALLQARQIVDRGLSVAEMRPQRRRSGGGLTNDVELLTGLRSRLIFNSIDIQQAKHAAESAFLENGDQTGFAMVSRELICRAEDSGRGGDFKKADLYISSCYKRVEEHGEHVSVGLRLCRLELVGKWNLGHGTGPVYWDGFAQDLASIQAAGAGKGDFMIEYWSAVYLYNTRDFSKAEIHFNSLRRKLWGRSMTSKIMTWYLGDESKPPELQGTLKKSGDNTFILCRELGVDILARRGDFNVSHQSLVHFHLGFSLHGALAVSNSRRTVDEPVQ